MRRPVRRSFLVLLGIVFPLLFPLSPGIAAGPAATVEMTDQMKFVPSQVTIQSGESVQWKNGSHYVHTVTADPAWATRPQNFQLPEGVKAFDSGDIRPGKTYQHKFTVPGIYRYFCIPHQSSGMVGEVTVKP